MPRYFAAISKQHLECKLLDLFGEDDEGARYLDLRKLVSGLQKDIKVHFDLENTSYQENEFGPDNLVGYHTTVYGLTFLGVCAGGDWEHPVFFIVYWDGRKVRAYVPTNGNPWNGITKQAYGNDDEQDYKDARKRWPDKEVPKDLDGWFEFDPQAIEVDIAARLQPLLYKRR